MLPLDPKLRDLYRKRRIQRDIFASRWFLRRGSVPKWCHTELRGRGDSIPEPEEEVRSLHPLEVASDRARVLREGPSNDFYHQITKSLNDLYPPPNPSQDRTEIRLSEYDPTTENKVDKADPHSLCETCKGINAEAIARESGYEHLLLQDINESERTCNMCKFLLSQFQGKVGEYTQDRYRVRISLDTGRDQWSEDHYKPSVGEREFSSALVQLMDLRPWELPEDYKSRRMYEAGENLGRFVEPQGSGPTSVRGRSVYCFTEEHDPARQHRLRWVRDIGANTASATSVEIAKSWLGKCLSSGDAVSGWRALPHSRGKPLSTRRSQADSRSSTSSESNSLSEVDATSESQMLSESAVVPEPDLLSEPDVSHEPDTPFRTKIRWEPLRQAFPQDRPARLIHICEASTEDNLKDLTIHLVDAREKTYQYAALSYCWGAQDPEEGRRWQLTEANDGPHHENIIMVNLPQTVRDSIIVSWKLGIDYIWIDALCIIQDSASDWAHEAAKMASIYRGSLITIAVSASISAEQGCFNSTSQRTTELSNFKDLITVKGKLPNGEESCLYFLDLSADIPDVYDEEISKAPLSRRAWTYQEHVLPRRVLYLTSKQLLWECMHCRLTEDNFPQTQSARPYPILDFDYILGKDDIAAFWYIGAVQQYSKRQMTFEKDKFIAISALAKATYYNKESDYIAGLWRDSLILGLSWCRSSNGHKSKTFPCPSWSWASQNSAVSYHNAADALDYADRQRMFRTKSERQKDECLRWPASRIISVDWKADQNNPFGNVSDAYIDLYTILGIGTVAPEHFNETSRHNNECFQAILIPYTSKSGKSTWCRAVATMDDSGVIGAHVAIALLREPTSPDPVFLLLDPPDVDAKTFRRVGLAEQAPSWQRYGDSDDWIQVTKTWAPKTIRLI